MAFQKNCILRHFWQQNSLILSYKIPYTHPSIDFLYFLDTFLFKRCSWFLTMVIEELGQSLGVLLTVGSPGSLWKYTYEKCVLIAQYLKYLPKRKDYFGNICYSPPNKKKTNRKEIITIFKTRIASEHPSENIVKQNLWLNTSTQQTPLSKGTKAACEMNPQNTTTSSKTP